jgi:hypothetical protein
MVEAFEKMWKPLEDEGYKMYVMYTSADVSALEGKVSCVIGPTSASGLCWEKVITPSQDSAVISSVQRVRRAVRRHRYKAEGSWAPA